MFILDRFFDIVGVKNVQLLTQFNLYINLHYLFHNIIITTKSLQKTSLNDE